MAFVIPNLSDQADIIYSDRAMMNMKLNDLGLAHFDGL